MLNIDKISESCDCAGGCCSEELTKKILVEYLYLDLETCDRCIGTDKVLDEIMEIISPALKLAGYNVEYNKVEMKTAEMARQYKFLSSPTIRINGKDICSSVQENSCGCCSEISGTDVECRVFDYNGELYEIPPKEMLANDILNSILGDASESCSCEKKYEMPENLVDFFKGKSKKNV